MIGISALVAAILFVILSQVAATVAEVYCFENDIPMTEFDWMEVDRWIFSVSGLFAVISFSILFLCLLCDRMDYIRTITRGIDALRAGQEDTALPLQGQNELTQLAQAINDMSRERRELRQREQALASEKEQLIRSLSHDIRTPLTSILAYSEYLGAQQQLDDEDRQTYLALIQRKAQQIRELTDILLDGSKRSPEYFENARLLMEQLAAEFESELEEAFQVQLDLSGCAAFAGSFDVQQLRRIFDNLSSNVQKYADPAQPVRLYVSLDRGQLLIRQSNAIRQPRLQGESYRIGLNSIRRIAQQYAGQVTVREDGGQFAIDIALREF